MKTLTSSFIQRKFYFVSDPEHQFSPYKLVPAEKHETPHFSRPLFLPLFTLSAIKQQLSKLHSFSELLNSMQHDATSGCTE
jgi:hypothetical protein